MKTFNSDKTGWLLSSNYSLSRLHFIASCLCYTPSKLQLLILILFIALIWDFLLDFDWGFICDKTNNTSLLDG